MKDPLSKWEDQLKEQAEQESLISRLFHKFMIALSLAIVFSICGALAFLAINRNRHFAMTMTPLTGLLVFCIGGGIGVGVTIYYYRRL